MKENVLHSLKKKELYGTIAMALISVVLHYWEIQNYCYVYLEL